MNEARTVRGWADAVAWAMAGGIWDAPWQRTGNGWKWTLRPGWLAHVAWDGDAWTWSITVPDRLREVPTPGWETGAASSTRSAREEAEEAMLDRIAEEVWAQEPIAREVAAWARALRQPWGWEWQEGMTAQDLARVVGPDAAPTMVAGCAVKPPSKGERGWIITPDGVHFLSLGPAGERLLRLVWITEDQRRRRAERSRRVRQHAHVS